MTEEVGFDRKAAHRFFSVNCFNETWELIDTPDRDEHMDVLMLMRTMASLWHWTQREDCQVRNFAIGYWQASHVLALMGEGELARRMGALCLESSEGESPFYLGYAYESLARAAAVTANLGEMEHFLAKAQECVGQIEDASEREQLIGDLSTIQI